MKSIRLMTVLAAVALPIALAESACSSGGTGGTGGGTTATTSGTNSTTTTGSTTGGGGSSTTTTTTTTTTTGAGGSSTTCTAPTTVTGVPTYTPVTHQSACSMADVAGFITACDMTGATNTTCGAWAAVAANAACAACIQPANGGLTGATIYDNQMNPYLNLPGCIQLTDGNTTCAAPLAEYMVCEDDACNSPACATDAEFEACETAAQTGACSAQHTASASCAADDADGGDLSANGACSTDSEVIYVICGNGQ